MTKENKLNNPTYTCVGSFDENGTLYLAAYLPPDKYDFKKFDVSTKDSNGNIINAVLLVLIKNNDSGTELEWRRSSPLHSHCPINFDIDKFDGTKDECLVLIYHQAEFDATNHLKEFKDRVNNWYHSAPNIIDFDPSGNKIQPKKLGMSIVRKYK